MFCNMVFYCTFTIHNQKQKHMKNFNFSKNEWERFYSLCKHFGLKVEVDATYTYSNLCETEHCYLRIIKNNNVIAIANLIN